MIRLRDKETGADIGTISEDQLQFLMDQLEEESDEDRDYYLQREMVQALGDRGADAGLIGLLISAMGEREGIEIEWSAE
jgi:hypothetical protein